jgi:hypothetical protein
MYPWYYVWSPTYRIFHEVLQFGAADISGVSLRPIAVPQNIFKRKTENEEQHFLTGIPIKIYCLLKSLKENPNQQILFSDADLIVLDKNLSEKLQTYEVNDITAMRADKSKDIYNIGFMMVKSTPEVIQFFETVMARIHKEKLLDQDVFNEEIKQFKGTHGFFDTKDFIQSCMIRKDIWDTGNYSLIKCLSAISSTKQAILGKLATIVYFYNIQHLIHFIDKEIFEELKEYISYTNPLHYIGSIDYDTCVSATNKFSENSQMSVEVLKDRLTN